MFATAGFLANSATARSAVQHVSTRSSGSVCSVGRDDSGARKKRRNEAGRLAPPGDRDDKRPATTREATSSSSSSIGRTKTSHFVADVSPWIQAGSLAGSNPNLHPRNGNVLFPFRNLFIVQPAIGIRGDSGLRRKLGQDRVVWRRQYGDYRFCGFFGACSMQNRSCSPRKNNRPREMAGEA